MADLYYKLIDLINLDSIFWFCALLGSGLFSIQLILNFFGANHFDDIELDFLQFKWLSKQAITGFLMMFGWIGLSCVNEFHLSRLSSCAISTFGGLLSMFFSALIFRGVKKLCSPGTVFNIEDAIGKEATVYQRIPKDGVGKISVSLNHFTYEIDAVSSYPEDLESFTPVKIIKKMDEKTVLAVPQTKKIEETLK